MPDIEISNGIKPKGKIDLDPLEWLIISVTGLLALILYKIL